jgi:hypothetical protein
LLSVDGTTKQTEQITPRGTTIHQWSISDNGQIKV